MIRFLSIVLFAALALIGCASEPIGVSADSLAAPTIGTSQPNAILPAGYKPCDQLTPALDPPGNPRPLAIYCEQAALGKVCTTGYGAVAHPLGTKTVPAGCYTTDYGDHHLYTEALLCCRNGSSTPVPACTSMSAPPGPSPNECGYWECQQGKWNFTRRNLDATCNGGTQQCDGWGFCDLIPPEQYQFP